LSKHVSEDFETIIYLRMFHTR